MRAYKTEINPTPEQIIHINKTLGVCRHVKNLFIETKRDIKTIKNINLILNFQSG